MMDSPSKMYHLECLGRSLEIESSRQGFPAVRNVEEAEECGCFYDKQTKSAASDRLNLHHGDKRI